VRALVPELESPFPLASFLPDVYAEDSIEPGGPRVPMLLGLPPGAYVCEIAERQLAGTEDLEAGARQGLLGEWILRVLAAAAGGDAGNGQAEPGERELALALTRDGRLLATGALRVSGGVLAVTTSNCGAAEGSYSWRFDGDALELDAVDDACASRRALLTAGRWRRRSFAVRFLSAFDDVLAPVFSSLDNIDSYVDPRLAPRDFVDWLAGWVDLAPNQGWPVRRRRDRIARAVQLAVWWGTADGIRDVVSVFAGVERSNVEVVENGATAGSATYGGELPGRPEQELKVRVKVAEPSKFDAERLNRIVANAKPAHLRHEVEVVAE
jgi:phage tail-like protein